MAGQEDFLRPLIQEVIQQVLEAEMEEVVGAGKRTHGQAAGLPVRVVWPNVSYVRGQAGIASAARPGWTVPDRSVRTVSAQ